MSEPDQRSVRVLDARSLRGLAHPLRVRLLGLLRLDGPATATQLAGRVGESSGTTSWHLRQLAEHGFIVEAAGRGNGRERWWRSADDATRVDQLDFVGDPDSQGALEGFLRGVLQGNYQLATAWLAELSRWDRAWVGAGTFSDWDLRLSVEELAELGERVEALIESYRHPPRDGDEAVSVQVQAFPRRSPVAEPPAQGPADGGSVGLEGDR